MKNIIDLSLYLVTNSDNKTKNEFLRVVEEAILGGVSIVQIREKNINTIDFYNLSIELKKITDKYNIPLIINDRLDLAIAIDADGVHIGQKDLPVKLVRKIIGNNKIVGVSASTLKDSIAAERDGADYIGTGAIFSTTTKQTEIISIKCLKKIVNKVNIPIIAIGGLKEDNIKILSRTGIKGIAISSNIMKSDNPQKTSRNLKNIFNKL
jgi:thiamine-phosphate pyrophosphorylase